jgi:ketosteroid isomerase-like protein
VITDGPTDMQEHPNATRIRALFQAFRQADLETILATISENAAWHFPGCRGRLAGTHRGRDQILKFLLDVQTLTDNTFHLELGDVIGNDQRVVVLFRGSGQRNGKTLDNPTCLRIDFRNGKVHEVWEFVWNLFDVDDFWS